ncbi:MAG: beta-lactamase family protein [Chitinophagales bacterium]|nr:beta-lactamase family protein [Chitinophagales bacterium]
MKRINRILTSCIFFLTIFSYNFVYASIENSGIDTVGLNSFLQEAQSQIGMPSISCAVIKNNKIIYRYENGFVNLEHDVKVTNKSIYPLYSLTKPFIAVGVFSLIEKGKLKLSDSISKYVKDVPTSWNGIKIKHLLTHSSGLPDMVGSNPYELRDLSEKEAKERVYSLPLRFTKGEKYEYSQTNFWLLKEIIEQVTQEELSSFILQTQFSKQKSKNVFFSGDAREIIKNRVTPYFPWVKGKLMIDLTYTNGDYFYACNGFHLTLDEFIAWDERLRNNELISEDSKKQMWNLFPYAQSNKTFTYGWEATKLDKKNAYGFSGAMVTFYRVYPTEDLSVIFLSNGFSKMYNQDAFSDELIKLILE